MTRLSKILTVFVTVASILFMAVATAFMASGYDWKAKAAQYPDQTKAARAEIEKIQEEKQRWQRRINESREFTPNDIKAMEEREQLLVADLKKVTDEIAETNRQIQSEAKRAIEKRRQVTVLRDETIQLENQLVEVRAQKTAALTEQKRLKDLLVQEQGLLERANRRKQLLQKDVTGSYDDGKPE